MLREQYQQEIDDIVSRYPVKRSALIPLLYLAQREQGYITEAAMVEIAGILKLTPPQVYETVTFYTMLNLKQVGKFHIQVCKSLMCALVGSDTLVGWIKAKLGIGPGETTPDGAFTLIHRGMPRSLRHRPDDADQRGLLRAADGREARPHFVGPQVDRVIRIENWSVHVAGTACSERGNAGTLRICPNTNRSY